MDLQWSTADRAFRDDVRAFLDQHLTDDLRQAGRLQTSVYSDHEASMTWQQILHRRGWAAPAWPPEHGGCGWTLSQHYIFDSESIRAGAPSLSPMGIRMVAHAIIAYGTEEQKNFFLPRILTGDVFFCQGYSEPEAGSDLAALSMAAVDDGADFLCTGSKIWTTHALEANWMFALVRTSRHAKKQRGITFILIDMTSSGITIRPLVMTSGEQIQTQVFFDDVRVTKNNVIGVIDDGWTVAKYLLEFERGGAAVAPALQAMAETLRARSKDQPGPDGQPLATDASFANQLADVTIRAKVLEILEYQVLAAVNSGHGPGAAASLLKVIGTELSQQLTELALHAAGLYGRAYQPHATRPGGPIADYQPPPEGYLRGQSWQAVAPLRYFNDRAGSIYAGSNEIQRNILAKTLLGL
jgi:alkylation response protein AidB-like acyl-CoA dehydrogenase